MSVEQLTITVPTEMAAALRRQVDDGEYASTGDIVREALFDWTRRHQSDRHDLDALREAIRIGDASGPSVPADEVFAEMYRIIDEHRVAR